MFIKSLFLLNKSINKKTLTKVLTKLCLIIIILLVVEFNNTRGYYNE